MKRWVLLIMGLVLCLNPIVAIIGATMGYLSVLLGVMQAIWGVLGIYLIIKAAILFVDKRIDKIVKDAK